MKNPQIKFPTGKRLIESARPVRLINCRPGQDWPNSPARQPGRLLARPSGGQICSEPLIILPGTGRKTFKMPSTEELILSCVLYINKLGEEQRAKQAAARGSRRRVNKNKAEAGEQEGANKAKQEQVRAPADDNVTNNGNSGDSAPAPVAPPAAAATVPVVNRHGGTLFLAAGGLSASMHAGRFEEHLAPIFDPSQGIEDWAAKHMPAKYQETVESLRFHWAEIKKLFVGDEERAHFHVLGALPSVMHAVSANFPGASEEQVISLSVNVISGALRQIMSVLEMWDSSFAQQRDGKYFELMYLTYSLEQAFKLMTAGAETMVMHVGDIYMPRYSGGGPATIPGARGPLNAHLMMVPFNMRGSLLINMPVFYHEFRHDVFADVPLMHEQMAEAVIDAIDSNAKHFNLSTKTITIAGQKVAMLDLIRQIFVQTLTETDADVAGGVLFTGPAFGFSLISLFSALNSAEENLLTTDALLRSDGYFEVDNDGEFVVGVHMPDYPRAYVVAEAMNQLGFTAAAGELRLLADQAAGDTKPTMVTWHNVNHDDRRFRFKIEVPFADLMEVAPVVVDAIMNTPLECLGNRSMRDLVFFDDAKQSKVEELTANLQNGFYSFRADIGDVHPNYVGAAAFMAYWNLCMSGVRPPIALKKTEAGARLMMDEVIRRNAGGFDTDKLEQKE